jgi:ankyrin repeat protein
MRCRGSPRGSPFFKETTMPRLSTVLLIARLALFPTTFAVPAAASEQPASTNADAATVSPVAAGMTQEHIKDLFFDAARQGRNDLVGGLIQSGMSPEERDPHGYTALILAAYNGQATTVDLLIQKGANPCATDSKGNSSLMGVAFKGETAIAKRLIAAGCDVNARNDAGQTALMMAALFGQTDVVKLLLADGANVELKDNSGNTASSLAEQQANRMMAKILGQNTH